MQESWQDPVISLQNLATGRVFLQEQWFFQRWLQ